MAEKQKFFIFDLDGTITAGETLPIIADYFDLKSDIAQLTDKAIKGTVPYIENFIQRVNLLKMLSVSKISEILAVTPLHPLLLQFIADHSSNCCVATTNLDLWISKLVLNIPCRVFSSRAAIDNDQIASLESILKKEEVVKQLQDSGYQTVFIGDGNNDLEAIRAADISIASGITHDPAPAILPFTDYLCYEEKTLCRLLKQLY